MEADSERKVPYENDVCRTRCVVLTYYACCLKDFPLKSNFSPPNLRQNNQEVSPSIRLKRMGKNNSYTVSVTKMCLLSIFTLY